MYRLFRGKFPYCLRDIKYIHRALKYRTQRACRGWADCDTWSIDMWFLEVVPQMLGHLRENRCSQPAHMTSEEWNSILGAMIFLLNEMNEETCSQQNDIEYTSDNADKFLARERELSNYMDHCKDEFFKMFSEHFYDLWD